MKDESKLEMFGHVLIKDFNTKEILVDKYNSIHYENMSIAISQALSNITSGHMYMMLFGNGGSIVSGTGSITYFPPNTTGMNSQIYNQTYSKVIDQNGSSANQSTGNVQINHIVNTLYTDIIITCILDYNEPQSQSSMDNSNVLESSFIFDELGIKAWNQIPDNGLLLTHVIFNPIQKSLNRQIEIVYTIRIQMA